MSVLDAPDTRTGRARPGPASDATLAPDTSRPEPVSRAAAWLAVLTLVLAAITLPRGPGDGFGTGTFGRVLAGTVERLADESWVVIPVGGDVPADATIRTTREAAEMAVRGGSVTLASGTQLSIEDDRVEPARGRVLFESSQPFTARMGSASARGRGAWRVDADGAARFAVYRGGLGVTDAGGDSVAVPARRQVSVVDGDAAPTVLPIRYLATDPWDRRLLAEAIAIDDLLADVSVNLRDTYGVALQSPSFYRDFVPLEGIAAGLDRLAPQNRSDRFGPPAPTIVAAAIADLLVQDARLDVAVALESITTLRATGASWGVIVRDQDLLASDVRSALDRALRERAAAIEAGTATAPRAPGADSTSGADPSGEAPRDGVGPVDQDPGGDGGTDPDGPTPPEEPDTLDPAEDAAEDLGELLEPVPGGSDAADTLGDAIDAVDDEVPPPPTPAPGRALPPVPDLSGVPDPAEVGGAVVQDGAATVRDGLDGP